MSVKKTRSKLLLTERALRDIPSRLAEMQPSLALEVELLHEQLRKRKIRQRRLYLLAGLEVQSNSDRPMVAWRHLALSPIASLNVSEEKQRNA